LRIQPSLFCLLVARTVRFGEMPGIDCKPLQPNIEVKDNVGRAAGWG
jgi:hypothetical protein